MLETDAQRVKSMKQRETLSLSMYQRPFSLLDLLKIAKNWISRDFCESQAVELYYVLCVVFLVSLVKYNVVFFC